MRRHLLVASLVTVMGLLCFLALYLVTSSAPSSAQEMVRKAIEERDRVMNGLTPGKTLYFRMMVSSGMQDLIEETWVELGDGLGETTPPSPQVPGFRGLVGEVPRLVFVGTGGSVYLRCVA